MNGSSVFLVCVCVWCEGLGGVGKEKCKKISKKKNIYIEAERRAEMTDFTCFNYITAKIAIISFFLSLDP